MDPISVFRCQNENSLLLRGKSMTCALLITFFNQELGLDWREQHILSTYNRADRKDTVEGGFEMLNSRKHSPTYFIFEFLKMVGYI